MPCLRNMSLCSRWKLSCTSAGVGASVPRPHAVSPKPAAPAHSARAHCRRPAAQCPAPAAAWVTTGARGDTHASVREGLDPSRRDIKGTRSHDRSLLSSPAILALSPRRRVCARLPGCRHPDVAPGGARAAPMLRSDGIRASAPVAHLSKVIPSTTSSTWLVDCEGELRVCGSYFAQDIKDLAGQGVGVNDRQELEPRATGVR